MINDEEFSGSYRKIVSNHSFSNDGFIGVNMHLSMFENCEFDDMVIYKADMTNCKIKDCRFNNVKFINLVSISNLIFENCAFVNCEFIDANLYDIKIRNCSFITNHNKID